MNTNARIDALQLMLTDLRMRNEPIRHKAAFRGVNLSSRPWSAG